MLRGILGGVAGYVSMFVFVMISFTGLYLVLGADGSFKEGAWTPSMIWIIVTFGFTLIAALLGGFVCAKIALAGSKAPTILAVVVLVLGLLMAIPALLAEPDPAKPARTADTDNMTAMMNAEEPLYVTLLNPIIGLVGVLAGARLVKKAPAPVEQTAVHYHAGMTNPTNAPTLSSPRPFGRTGLLVSPLGFGGAPIGNLDTDADVVARILDTMLDHGVNLVDTAHAYHGSEELIGRAIARRRDDVVLVTKCGSKWIEDDLPPAWTPEYIRATIDRSLTRLRTDRIDVMLLHSCDLETLRKGDALAAAVAARDAGKVRFVGYSGDDECAAWAAGQPDVAVIQTSVSICDQRNIDVVLPLARTADIGVMAKRPVANAAWKPRDDQYEKYRKYAEPYCVRFEKMAIELDALRAACGAAIDWPEIALRFTLGVDGVHTAIVGTTRIESMNDNLAAAAKGPLPEAASAMIRAAFTAADPEEEWKGLT